MSGPNKRPLHFAHARHEGQVTRTSLAGYGKQATLAQNCLSHFLWPQFTAIYTPVMSLCSRNNTACKVVKGEISALLISLGLEQGFRRSGTQPR
jgi:hypothetical protein